MTVAVAMIGAAKAVAAAAAFAHRSPGDPPRAVAYPEVVTGVEHLLVTKWHPTDEPTYGVSASDWNRWVFERLAAANPLMKVLVL